MNAAAPLDRVRTSRRSVEGRRVVVVRKREHHVVDVFRFGRVRGLRELGVHERREARRRRWRRGRRWRSDGGVGAAAAATCERGGDEDRCKQTFHRDHLATMPLAPFGGKAGERRLEVREGLVEVGRALDRAVGERQLAARGLTRRSSSTPIADAQRDVDHVVAGPAAVREAGRVAAEHAERCFCVARRVGAIAVFSRSISDGDDVGRLVQARRCR